MTRILLLVSLVLLIGIVLSQAEDSTSREHNINSASTEDKTAKKEDKSGSREDRSASKDQKDKSSSKDKRSKAISVEDNNSESKEKHAEKHKKHRADKSDEKVKDDTDKHEKHGSHDKHKKHDSKSKHSKSKKHHKKHSDHKQHKKDTEIIDKDDIGWEYENKTPVDTRRILYSKTTQLGKRKYMVYLQLTKESAKAHKYRGWLCGGVIVERYYVLTSAACVEDAEHFYVVSGTRKFVDSFDYKNDECACKHRRKVVWKCIPKNYKFDFQDSIKWSSNDIAIVKVNKPFKFGVKEKGCEFETDMICFNNVSRELEKPGTKGWIAGWGSGSNFREGVYRRQKSHVPENAKCLQEARVCIMDNEQCAKKWSSRFRSIITQYMICTKDIMKRLSEICDKRYANCTDVDDGKDDSRRSDNLIDLGRHLQNPDALSARRSNTQGGFCENDHGGPLIVKYQNKERVIGIISACKIDPKTHSCHGPFLYTSVFKNRQFISCSIYKDTEETCRRVFRTGITHEEWNVDWDGVKEDDDDDRKDDDKKDSDESAESKEALRQSKNDKEDKKEDKKADKKDKKAAKSSSESSSSEESKEKKHKAVDKSDKPKSSKLSGEKKAKTDRKESSSSSSSSSEEERKARRDMNVFYESSRDDNVNEPGSDE